MRVSSKNRLFVAFGAVGRQSSEGEDTMKLFCCLAVLVAFAMSSMSIDTLQDYRNLERHCPAPFFAVGPQCFYVNRAEKSWSMGRAACQRIGGDLADPSNTYLLLEAIRDKHESWVEKFFWVGGEIFTKDSDGSMWAWFSGRPVTEWAPNQANAREGEDCLMLGLNDDPPMYDYFCNETYPFVCEI
ncbi:lectin BRA-2-like [Penaeus japonicus]|uniref:lectin BRA-2-like n=1 Tax=Penaeus japonicus TaxID=27405 RepID=UPI001C70D639|nr:lectin BRA-2-like [Penaeus japonicus]